MRLVPLWLGLLALSLWPHPAGAAPDSVGWPSPPGHRQPRKELSPVALDVRVGTSLNSASLLRLASETRPLPFRVGLNLGPELSLGARSWAFTLWPRFQHQQAGDFYRHLDGVGLSAGALHRWVHDWHVFGLGLGIQGSVLFGPMVSIAWESQLRVPFRWSYYASPQLGVTAELAGLFGTVSLRGKRNIAIGEMSRNLASDVTAGGELNVGFCFP